MNEYIPLENEKTFQVHPVGVMHECPFCHEGEMESDTSSDLKMPKMFPHKCTKCGKTMMLPKVYPYIEWLKAATPL